MFVSDFIDSITKLFKNRTKDIDATFRIHSQYHKDKDLFEIGVEKINVDGNSKTVGEFFIENARDYFLTCGDGMFDIDNNWNMIFEV